MKREDLEKLVAEDLTQLRTLDLLNRGIDLRHREEIRQAFQEAGIAAPKRPQLQYRPTPANQNLTHYRVQYEGIDDVLRPPSLYEGYDLTAAEQAFWRKVREVRQTRERVFVLLWAGPYVRLGYNVEEDRVHAPKKDAPARRKRPKKDEP